MDDHNRQRRHHDLLTDHASKSRFTTQPARSLNQSSGPDRLRPTPINTSPQTPRSISTSSNYAGYYQESQASFSSSNMPSAALGGYGTEYAQDGRQQSQNFGGYGTAAMMYNVPQPSTQNSVYDTQQFGSRQATNLQIMAPDVASTYFGPDAANASSSSLHQSSQPSASTANVYQQSPSIQYGGNMSGISGVQQTPGSADVSMNEDPEYSDGALEEKWINYQRQLGTIFQDITSGSLEAASETLLSISSWLLSQVVDLGTYKTCTSLHIRL
jgi:hypothetical protein